MSDPHRSLVLRVNELFHDAEGAMYAQAHPEIFDRETARWKAALARHLGQRPDEARTCLDIGCGTGFVGLLLCPYLGEADTLVCADISATMLSVAERNLRAAGIRAALEAKKMDGESVRMPDASADVVTMNSVLHHVPDPAALLATVERVLKPGGIAFIGHEPNRRFFQSRFLQKQASLIHHLAPKRAAAAILKMLGLYHKAVAHEKDPLTDAVNEKLLAEGVIERPLSKPEMSRLIDAHSPTAGGLRRDEGFDPLSLFAAYPGMEIIGLETYNHIGKTSGKHAIVKPYERLLASVRPTDGSTFFLVARKKG